MTLDDFVLDIACVCFTIIVVLMFKKPRWVDELSKKR